MTLPRPIISQEMVTPNQRVEPYRVLFGRATRGYVRGGPTYYS